MADNSSGSTVFKTHPQSRRVTPPSPPKQTGRPSIEKDTGTVNNPSPEFEGHTCRPAQAQGNLLTREERLNYHILLVCPPYSEHLAAGQATYPPVGITLLATILKEAGYQVHLVDGALDAGYIDKLNTVLASKKLLYAGFSVMTAQLKAAINLSAKVKSERPGTPIVWGGFHPTIYPEQTIVHELIDFIITGEAAPNIVAFSDILAKGELRPHEIPGICYTERGIIKKKESCNNTDFSNLPSIDWSFYDTATLERAITGYKMLGSEDRCLPLLTGLGCIFKCSFCINTLFRTPYRTMSAKDVYNNINLLHEKYKVTHIIFYDEYFFGSKKRLNDLLDLLQEGPLPVKFYASMRSSDFNRLDVDNTNIIERLVSCGFYSVGIGAESGNERILKKLNKGIKVHDTINLAKACEAKGLICFFSFIIGVPSETVAEMLDTLQLIDKIHQQAPSHKIIGPQVFRPYPGSQLFLEATEKGLREPASVDEWVRTDLLSTFKVVDPDIVPWIPHANKLKYLMASYNIQSTECSRPYLATLAVSSFQKSRLAKFIPIFLRKTTELFIRKLVMNVASLQTFRIRKRFYYLFVEKDFVAWLERKYF